jgi:hypothetical protein
LLGWHRYATLTTLAQASCTLLLDEVAERSTTVA